VRVEGVERPIMRAVVSEVIASVEARVEKRILDVKVGLALLALL
jgi:hypothetical protein